ncbi:MAG: twin-arginine translocase subunit TatC, partial [bacterium]
MSAARPAPETQREELPTMTLLDHLEELRKRLLYSLIAVLVALLGAWSFKEQIFLFLSRPIEPFLPEGRKLAFLGVTDPFLIYFKMCALAGIFVAAPFLIYQAYAFIAPGLYQRERRWAVPFVLLGTLFFVAGGAFAYTVAFPFAVEFLLGMGAPFEAVITVQKYFGFLMTVILGLGLMFELPIFIFLLATIGLVTPEFLWRHFRWAVLLIFIVAALVTPTPDVVNLCIFALPTVG